VAVDGQAAVLHFNLAGPPGGGLELGLKRLDADQPAEFWLPGTVDQTGCIDGISWARAGRFLGLSLVAEDDPAGDPEPRVFAAYQRLIELARRLGHPHLVRAWNYLPGINSGEADEERYRRFCVGRGRAFEQAGLDERSPCAGTAIGSDEAVMRVMLLCATEPGLNVENPRQLSAYDYPRQYGPRSPAFARATALSGAAGEWLLMLSGTASVVGHETRHIGDVLAQTREILANVDSLLQESALRTGAPGLQTLGRHSLARVYLRHAEDWAAVEPLLRRAWPEVRLAAFRGDVCRADLLVEIELVTQA